MTIELSQSEWSSPCILVPKPDGTFSHVYGVNSVTKTDTYLIPRIDDCINNIGQVKYVTKFDLLKGFWQKTSDRQSKGDLSICYSRQTVSDMFLKGYPVEAKTAPKN